MRSHDIRQAYGHASTRAWLFTHVHMAFSSRTNGSVHRQPPHDMWSNPICDPTLPLLPSKLGEVGWSQNFRSWPPCQFATKPPRGWVDLSSWIEGPALAPLLYPVSPPRPRVGGSIRPDLQPTTKAGQQKQWSDEGMRWSVKRFIASISLPELNASSLHCLNFLP